MSSLPAGVPLCLSPLRLGRRGGRPDTADLFNRSSSARSTPRPRLGQSMALCHPAKHVFVTDLAQAIAADDSLAAIAEPADEIPHELLVDSHELQQVLNELPEEFRTPLILFYFDEFTYREIAEQMNIPIGTVMSRLARARAYLRRRLEDDAIVADSLKRRRRAAWIGMSDFGPERWTVELHLRFSIVRGPDFLVSPHRISSPQMPISPNAVVAAQSRTTGGGSIAKSDA